MTDLPFLVAGGGIAGLAAALGLSRAGHAVDLYEQASAFEEVGAGLQMSPNGVRALMQLGAWEAVAPHCVIPSEIHVRDGLSGSLLQRIRLGKPFEERFGAPYRVCHRADLLAGLLASVRAQAAIELHTNYRVLSARLQPQDATLEFANGKTAIGRAIIAADGIQSTLRQLVCGRVGPMFRGHTLFRALIPLHSVPPEIEADCVTLWLCPGGHVVHYPVSNWRNFNIAAAVNADAASPGWGEPRSGSDVLQHFRRATEDLASLLSQPAQWTSWQAADLPELPRWSNGNLLLLGDAAHATLPYLAQGAVMALEDAATLSGVVADGYSEKSFARFERMRKTRTAQVQRSSRRLGRIYHATGITAVGRNAVLRLAGPRLVSRQTSWLYDWLPDGQRTKSNEPGKTFPGPA